MTGRMLQGLAAGLLLALAVSTASADVVDGQVDAAAGSADLELTLLPVESAGTVEATSEPKLASLSKVLNTRFIRGDRFAPQATAPAVHASLDTNKFIPLPELSSVVLLTLTGTVSLIVWWVRRRKDAS